MQLDFAIKTEDQLRIEELEEKVLALQNLLHFHGLDKIPIKYRKAFPKGREYPYFETDEYPKNHKIACESLSDAWNSGNPQEISLPSIEHREEAFKKAKENLALYLASSSPTYKIREEIKADAKRNSELIKQAIQAESQASS